jgi:hypothetical protein
MRALRAAEETIANRQTVLERQYALLSETLAASLESARPGVTQELAAHIDWLRQETLLLRAMEKAFASDTDFSAIAARKAETTQRLRQVERDLASAEEQYQAQVDPWDRACRMLRASSAGASTGPAAAPSAQGRR